MKIRFKKKKLYPNLIIGIVWIGLGISSLLRSHLGWSFTVIGILYIGHFLFDLTNQYLTIENGIIRKNGLHGFGKEINLNEIASIKKFAGDYILKTESKELKINTDLIEEKSLAELDRILGNLNLPLDKTPFAKTVNN